MPIDYIVATPHDADGVFNDCFRNSTASAGYLACNNLYNRVVLNEWYNPDPCPDLATHWEMLDGGRRWRFHLNQAARWHDGVPVTAHDVAYSHLHARDKQYTAGRFLTEVVDIIEVNRHTVDYVLAEPNSAFCLMIGNFIFTHVLPAHLYEGTDWATNPYNQNPVGSGPFRFGEWVPGKHVILEAVKDHWGPRPEIDRIIIKVVPDRDECVRMVGRGEAHLVTQDTLTIGNLHLLDEATVPVDLHTRRGPGQALLAFNHARPGFDDRRVREAVGRIIDREAMRPLSQPGVSEPWPHFSLGNHQWSFAEDAVAPAHDLAEAHRLLDEAGLPVREDGTRTEQLSLYWLESFHAHGGISRIVADQLTAAGLPTIAAPLSAAEWATRVVDEGAYDLCVTGGSMTPELMITRAKYSSDGLNNFARYSNTDVDAAYARAAEAPTKSARAEAYKDLQRIWARDVEWLPLFWYGIYYPRSKDFFGWADQLGFTIPWWHWGRMRPVGR